MNSRQPESPYKPISDYSLVGDIHSCALVSRDGSVDWACFPRFDSRAVFTRLLDSDKGGHFTVRLRGPFGSSRRYLPATNILETTFRTPFGVAVLTDFMPVHGHSKPAHPHDQSILGAAPALHVGELYLADIQRPATALQSHPGDRCWHPVRHG
jgi:GH15 family glucan-1,4-alpha-glucosidase